MAILSAAFTYFLLVFLAGVLFGAAREFVLVPLLGRDLGQLAEAPLMLAAIVLGAWATVARHGLAPSFALRLGVGLSSLAMVMVAEFALSPAVRGSMAAWFASFTPLSLTVAIVLWAAHALMPALMLVRR